MDGRVGFTGGVGVAPQWTGRAQDPAHWRDTHFEVEGPVVAQMQSAFIDSASAQTATFESDLALSDRGSFAQWQARPAREKLHEWLASVIRTQL